MLLLDVHIKITRRSEYRDVDSPARDGKAADIYCAPTPSGLLENLSMKRGMRFFHLPVGRSAPGCLLDDAHAVCGRKIDVERTLGCLITLHAVHEDNSCSRKNRWIELGRVPYVSFFLPGKVSFGPNIRPSLLLRTSPTE